MKGEGLGEGLFLGARLKSVQVSSSRFSELEVAIYIRRNFGHENVGTQEGIEKY